MEVIFLSGLLQEKMKIRIEVKNVQKGRKE